MRVADRFYADNPHAGGLIHVAALALGTINQAGTGPLAFARTAAGDYQITVPTGGTSRIVLDLSADGALRRLIESYQAEGAFQEGFNLAPPAPGRPPFTGISQFSTPTQAGPPKGIRVDDIFIEYSVTGGADLTSLTPSLNKTIYAENVAPAITNFPVTTVAAPLTQQANPHIARWTVNAPVFVTDDFSTLTAEFTFVVAGGTANVRAAGAHVHFNYN
jgi:hypothetical protein